MNTTNEVIPTQTTPTQDATTALASAKVSVAEGVWVEISRITVPEDARKHTPEDIDSRAISLAKEGQLENILLSKEGDQLVLVYGNGRLESAKKAGWEKIRADIKEGLTETQKLLMTLAENEEREDASPFYTASLYKRLKTEEKLQTPGELAEKIGKDRSVIARYLSLAEVPEEVQRSVRARTVSVRQCLEIAKLTNMQDQLTVMEECASQDLSGKALEKRVKQLLNPKPAAPETAKPEDGMDCPFQFKRKGKKLVIESEQMPEMCILNLYLDELRCALIDFFGREEQKARQKLHKEVPVAA